MFIGSTAKERPEDFIIIEKGDTAQNVQALMTEKKVFNLILDAKSIDDDILDNFEFKSIFQQVEILYLNGFDIQSSAQLYSFEKLKGLEIFNCTFKNKEIIDFQKFNHLERIISPYSKRFVNLFHRPKLKTLMLENFNELNFVFPENNVLETLSIDKSKACDWKTLKNFKNLKSLYLVSIQTLVDISWINHLSRLNDLELSKCKHIDNCIEDIAQIKTLETHYLSYMGDFETLQPLKKLKHLQEFRIESGGKLADNKNVDLLFDMPNLEFGIDMRNCKCSHNCIK